MKKHFKPIGKDLFFKNSQTFANNSYLILFQHESNCRLVIYTKLYSNSFRAHNGKMFLLTCLATCNAFNRPTNK